VTSRWIQAVRRQGNIISIIAVTFALTSSALKEHYNEKFKDAASALERATDKVDLLNQFEDLRNEGLSPVELTREDIDNPDLFEQNGQTLFDNLAKYKNKIQFDFPRLDFLKASVHFTKEQEKRYTEDRHQQKDLFGRYETMKHIWKPDLLTELILLQKEFEGLHLAIKRLTDQVLEKLDKNAEDARKLKEITAQVSFFIFPVGIVLALLGQIAKVKADGGE
jgi:hypothetical protein